MSAPSCPRCGTEVGATWRWCLACGYDPDGTQKRIRDAHVEAHLKKGSWTPVIVVLIGMCIGAAILWRTTPEDDETIKAAPTTTAVAAWQSYAPTDGGFRVDFPAPPHEEGSAAVPDTKVERAYVSTMNEHLYAVVVTDTGRPELDAGVSEEAAQSMLLGFLQRSAATTGGRVTLSLPTRVSTAPALEYQLDTGVSTSSGRVVLVGHTVFSVFVSGPSPERADVDHFVGSFSLQ